MKWEKEEDILVLNLYLNEVDRRAVGRDHDRVIDLSHFTNRPAASLAMRTGNVAAIDPENPNPGLRNYARQTKEVWDEFHADPERLACECHNIRRRMKEFFARRESKPPPPESPERDTKSVRQKVKDFLVGRKS